MERAWSPVGNSELNAKEIERKYVIARKKTNFVV